MQYKTTAAAREASRIAQLDIKPQTLRNWTRVSEFDAFWSDDANPMPGHVRTFNDHDIAVIVEIARLRIGNLSYPEIANRLPEILSQEEPRKEEPQEPPQDPPDAPGTAITPAPMQYDLSPIVTATNANSTRLSTVEQRLAAVEAQRVNLHAIIAAFALGMLTIAIAVAIAVAMIR